MRYLTLAADYTRSAVRDDFVGPVVPEEAGLSEDLGDRIRDWNSRYRAIIPLGEDARAAGAARQLIDSLDVEGLALVAEITKELGNAKARYFSEGELRYLEPGHGLRKD